MYSDAIFFNPAQTSASWLRSLDLVPLHAASRIGAHKVVFLKNESVCENQTNEPRAVRRASLRAASRANEVLCTPNSTSGYTPTSP